MNSITRQPNKSAGTGSRPLRTLIVTHYFPPEIGAPQARLSELARAWANTGDDVTVLTGMPNHPTGVIPPKYRGRIRMREHVDGYEVIRTWLFATPNEGFTKKTIGHLSFMISSVLIGIWSVRQLDVVVVSSPTFFSIWSAWLIAKIKRARFVVEIRDLWPAIFVDLGVIHNQRIIRTLEIAELTAYRWADSVVVVSEGFRQNLIERGVPENKVHTIRNGVDLQRFGEEPEKSNDRDTTRKRLGITSPDDVLVLYLGAHGISHGLKSVADAAALTAKSDQLDGNGKIQFVFVGEGAAKSDLEAHVARLASGNVTMLPGVPRNEVPALLGAADICLVPLRDIPLFKTFIPSKIFEYLAAKKAVIGSVAGESAEILSDAGAVVVEPENPRALADAIINLARNTEKRIKMGDVGRQYVADNFDRDDLAMTYRAILEETVSRSAINGRGITSLDD